MCLALTGGTVVGAKKDNNLQSKNYQDKNFTFCSIEPIFKMRKIMTAYLLWAEEMLWEGKLKTKTEESTSIDCIVH